VRDARAAVVAVLEEGGATVTACDSVATALAAVHAGVFDAVISDIGMPVEDGYVLIRRLREQPTTTVRRLPTVALTAYANRAEVERILRAGFDVALTKPIEAKALIAEVARLAHEGGVTSPSNGERTSTSGS
jgi:CheY-like chemotaxis protein